jgi:hypothetical protein
VEQLLCFSELDVLSQLLCAALPHQLSVQLIQRAIQPSGISRLRQLVVQARQAEHAQQTASGIPHNEQAASSPIPVLRSLHELLLHEDKQWVVAALLIVLEGAAHTPPSERTSWLPLASDTILLALHAFSAQGASAEERQLALRGLLLLQSMASLTPR